MLQCSSNIQLQCHSRKVEMKQLFVSLCRSRENSRRWRGRAASSIDGSPSSSRFQTALHRLQSNRLRTFSLLLERRILCGLMTKYADGQGIANCLSKRTTT